MNKTILILFLQRIITPHQPVYYQPLDNEKIFRIIFTVNYRRDYTNRISQSLSQQLSF